MNFSGVIQLDEISGIQEFLKKADSFRCYGIDCYERYWDLTDEEYRTQLERKREEIVRTILERCRTKRKNLYITGPFGFEHRSKIFCSPSSADKEGRKNLANRFVEELVDSSSGKGSW